MSASRVRVPSARPRAAARPPVALYLHVPFCRSLCPYCDFVVVAGAAAAGPRNRVGAFMAALLRELDLRAAALDAASTRVTPPHGRRCARVRRSPGRAPLDTVYVGGGTPSLLPADAVAELIERVRARFGLADGAEVTLEANPGPEDRGDLAGFARAGVTRLSLGAQSLDDAELRSLGRRHRAGDVADAVLAARAAGIAQVSLDLLYDLPGQRLATWMGTIEAALEMAPDHVSCYALTLDDPDAEGLTGPLGDHLPTTAGCPPLARSGAPRPGRGPGGRRVLAGRRRPRGRRHALVRASNWARPGAESRHNLVYWERRPYEAVGPGAHAFDGVRRRWNAARLDAWLGALAPAPGRAPLTPARRRRGDRCRDRRRGGAHPRAPDGARHLARASPLPGPTRWRGPTRRGSWRTAPGERVRLTLRGRLLSNELFARLV